MLSNEFEFVAFNLSNKILKEREVRTAIAYAVDREQIISSILPGEAVASDCPLFPIHGSMIPMLYLMKEMWKRQSRYFQMPDGRKQRYILQKNQRC